MKKSFKIYQIDNNAENARYIKFMGLDFIEEMGLTLTKSLYKEVWSDEIESDSPNNEKLLDKIFEWFNLYAPENFRGHSLSVSDIIEMDGHYFYCDSYGWKEVEL